MQCKEYLGTFEANVQLLRESCIVPDIPPFGIEIGATVSAPSWLYFIVHSRDYTREIIDWKFQIHIGDITNLIFIIHACDLDTDYFYIEIEIWDMWELKWITKSPRIPWNVLTE